MGILCKFAYNSYTHFFLLHNMDRIQALQIFARTVESGSFTKAADQLNLHISVVSKGIKYLETQLGSRLLNRTTRKLALTAEGEVFYEKCQTLLAELENTFQDLSGSAQQAVGKLRIDMPPSLVNFVMSRLPEFHRQYPDIQLVVSASDKVQNLIDEGLDCAIRMGELDDAGYIARRLGDLPMVLCAAPRYLSEFGSPKTLDDLEHHRAIHYFSDKHRKIMPWRFEQGGNDVGMKIPCVMSVNDSNVLLQAVLAGFGISYMSCMLADPYLENGSLVKVLPDYHKPSRPVWLVYPQREFIPKRLEVFIEWLLNTFKEYCN
ncbi:LysR family transcriptional regulator [Bibersteinia trehalosi]|uniref:LysR family transcriptional regulator n=1 Tax=Bibersteinia trehalosi TaxID=47735 RepID=UPI0010F18620|nr:LysR family transcriptional regulator [Bibersteinia trehalosi]TCT16475.1 LysR family transcriptional regulator [Bibersteinia trehalosi]